MATFRQIAAATAALGMSWPRIVEVCARDLGEHGVLTDADLRRLDRPAGYRVGDVVAMRGHGRYRAARVWKVPHRSRCTGRVSALYLTPTSLAEDRVATPALCNITATPLGLITATPPTAHTRPRPAHPPRSRASPDREQAGPARPGLGCPPAAAAATNTNAPKGAVMKIHAVMYRDPDEPSELTVFLDGEPREVEVFDFDPGAGHNRFDIEKQRDDMRTRTDLAPGVRDLCEHHYARVLDSPYTTED